MMDPGFILTFIFRNEPLQDKLRNVTEKRILIFLTSLLFFYDWTRIIKYYSTTMIFRSLKLCSLSRRFWIVHGIRSNI